MAGKKIERLNELFDRVLDICVGNESLAENWINTALPALDDKTPGELSAQSKEGHLKVLELVNRLEYGALNR